MGQVWARKRDKVSVLEKIKSAVSGQIVRDKGERGSVKGLHVRVRGEMRTFYLYYRSKDGVQRWPKIGEFGQITLAQAREAAKVILDRVAKGEDPQGMWAKARAEMTVADLFGLAYDRYWGKPRFVKSGWAKEVRGYFDRSIAPCFGSRKLSSISVAEVRDWHAGLEDSPYAGNRALEVLTKMFNIAEAEEIIPRNTTPCWKIRAFTEKKRKRYATPAELGKILTIMEREKANNPSAVAFLYCVLFTGSRPSALERARYDQLKIAEYGGQRMGILEFEGKGTADSGEDETLIIPSEALAMIENLPRTGDGRIFGCKNPRRFWLALRKEAGCEDLWARDLRRTFATIGMSGGVDKNVIGKLLNHASSETTDIYAKLQLDARIEAVNKIADLISNQRKVVPIR